MDVMNAVKSVLADVLSVSPLSEQASKYQPTHSLRRSAYPYQPHVDTSYVLPSRRRIPKLSSHRD